MTLWFMTLQALYKYWKAASGSKGKSKYFWIKWVGVEEMGEKSLSWLSLKTDLFIDL